MKGRAWFYIKRTYVKNGWHGIMSKEIMFKWSGLAVCQRESC